MEFHYSFQKYLSTVIADDVNENTVAAIKENSDTLQGVGIEVNTLRQYNDSAYFAHIIGYTGNASPEDLAELASSEHDYNGADMVGKSGIEKYMNNYLSGTKGVETLYVDSVGNTIAEGDYTPAVSGNDVYLSIDMDLQKAAYILLEQEIKRWFPTFLAPETSFMEDSLSLDLGDGVVAVVSG